MADQLHIQPWGVFAPSVVTGQISEVGSGQFSTEAIVYQIVGFSCYIFNYDYLYRYIQTSIVNHRSTEAEFDVVSEILTPEGKSLGITNNTITISPSLEITVTQTIVVENINLWSAESPNLYPCISYPS